MKKQEEEIQSVSVSVSGSRSLRGWFSPTVRSSRRHQGIEAWPTLAQIPLPRRGRKGLEMIARTPGSPCCMYVHPHQRLGLVFSFLHLLHQEKISPSGRDSITVSRQASHPRQLRTPSAQQHFRRIPPPSRYRSTGTTHPLPSSVIHRSVNYNNPITCLRVLALHLAHRIALLR
jgi:hypothetical protein